MVSQGSSTTGRSGVTIREVVTGSVLRIRADGSELRFTWNPENPTDPIDRFLRQQEHDDAIVRKGLGELGTQKRLGLAIGAGAGAFLARWVQMTQMPEMVAAFNGLGGGASMFVALASLVFFGAGLSEGASIADSRGIAQAITLPITIEGVWHPGNEETGKLRMTFDDLVLGILRRGGVVG